MFIQEQYFISSLYLHIFHFSFERGVGVLRIKGRVSLNGNNHITDKKDTKGRFKCM